MPEITIQGHRGLQRQAASIYTEKADPVFALVAQDVVFDLEQTLYSAKGFSGLATASVASAPATCDSLYYSYIYDVLFFMEGTTLTVANPSTGVVLQTISDAFISGAVLSYIDWPLTGKVYISDGTTYSRVDLSGSTYSLSVISTGSSSNYAAGKQVIIWDDRVWALEPPSALACEAVPSNAQDPETFLYVNAIRLVEDGPNFNAATGNDNVLFIHKLDTILAVVGSVSDGSLAIRNLRTGRGAISKTAVWTFEGIDYFIAKDGFYRFNGMGIESLTKNITQLVAPYLDNIGANPGTTVTINPTLFNYVVPLVPLWSPDYGRRYILFATQFGSTNARPLVYKFDVDFEDWTTVFDNSYLTFTSLAYSSYRTKTYCMYTTSKNIGVFCDTPTYNGLAITGIYQTGQITGGTTFNEKQFQVNQFYPNIYTGNVQIFVDINGLGTYPWQLTDGSMNSPATKTGLALDRFSTGYMMSVKFVINGGGVCASSGFAVYAEPEEDRAGRDFYASRSDTGQAILSEFSSSTPSGSVPSGTTPSASGFLFGVAHIS